MFVGAIRYPELLIRFSFNHAAQTFAINLPGRIARRNSLLPGDSYPRLRATCTARETRMLRGKGGGEAGGSSRV